MNVMYVAKPAKLRRLWYLNLKSCDELINYECECILMGTKPFVDSIRHSDPGWSGGASFRSMTLWFPPFTALNELGLRRFLFRIGHVRCFNVILTWLRAFENWETNKTLKIYNFDAKASEPFDIPNVAYYRGGMGFLKDSITPRTPRFFLFSMKSIRICKTRLHKKRHKSRDKSHKIGNVRYLKQHALYTLT